MSDIEPRIPSINDPFNLSGCAQLPFPLTPSEDIILKHILGICASDYQMSKRAYDSIICMWAKKNQLTSEPSLFSITPNDIPEVDTTVLTLDGADFTPLSQVWVRGMKEGGMTFISSTQITIPFSYDFPESLPVFVTNPGSPPSNNLNLFIHANTKTPRVASISPATHSKATGNMLTITVTGSGFVSGCRVLMGDNEWGMASHPTTFVSSTQITANVNFNASPGPMPIGSIAIRVENVITGVGYRSYPAYITLTA